ncbi:hypothetical protein AB0B45_30115 [Nonomuraea sp. NPDC049152]|uniref:hypothetical protein n=1 Tax=Nonomuraea sp. NPDC049152 TaxID=3154350 RepID=UPI0033EEF9A1
MKIAVATLSFALFALVGLVSPAHADDTPAYTCIIANLSDNGTLDGAYCQENDGAPARGRITEPFAVWSPLQLTRLIVCTSGYADTPSRITAYGCQRLL